MHWYKQASLETMMVIANSLWGLNKETDICRKFKNNRMVPMGLILYK